MFDRSTSGLGGRDIRLVKSLIGTWNEALRRYLAFCNIRALRKATSMVDGAIHSG